MKTLIVREGCGELEIVVECKRKKGRASVMKRYTEKERTWE